MRCRPLLVRSLLVLTGLSCWAAGASPAGAQSPAASAAGDWPCWRGAHGDDSADAPGLFAKPFELVARWRAPVGSGYSGIAVQGELVVTLAARDGEDAVVALGAADGKERWRTPLDAAFPGQDGAEDGPVSTPALAGDAVFALGPRGQLLCLAQEDGAVRWRTHLADEHGAPRPHWGFTSAPLVVGDVVIVAAGAGPGRELLAFATKDGALRWAGGEDEIDYASPLLTAIDGRELVLCAGNKRLSAFEPASGALAWSLPHGGQDFYATIQNPLVVEEGTLLLKNRQMSSRLVRLAGGEGAPELEELWSSRHLRQNYSLSVAHDGLLFGYGGSFLSCVDAASGELVWRSRAPGDGWVILADGHLVVLTKNGSLHVAPAGPDGWEEQATLAACEHLCWTPPSLAQGRIFARDSARDLVCVDVVPRRASGAARDASAVSALPRELQEALAAGGDAGAAVAAYLAGAERVPVVEDGRIAHFFWRGAADEVVVQGDLRPDGAPVPMTRVADTDVFHAALELAPDARLGYQFVRDLDQTLADPLNPRTGPTMTMLGPMSELLMPAAEAPPELVLLAEDAFESFTLEVPLGVVGAQAWGGARRVRVQLPPGYSGGSERYPVLYVNDGDAARTALGLPGVLAAGGGFAPLIAVYVERQSAYEFARSQQEVYRDLLVERIVPEVDQRYRTIARPEGRAILGYDEAGYAAAFAGLSRACFGKVAVLSLLHGSSQGAAVLDGLVRAREHPPEFVIDWGRFDARDPVRGIDTPGASRALAAALTARGGRVVTSEHADSNQFSFWRAHLAGVLAALFPAR